MQQVCDCYRDVDVYMFCSVYSVNLLFQLFLLPQEGWRRGGGVGILEKWAKKCGGASCHRCGCMM